MKTSSILSSKELKRMTRFLVVGAVGTFLDFGVLTVLKAIGLATLYANSISFTLGVINNYTWNRLWTFAGIKHADWRRQLVQFTLVSLIGLAFNNIIVVSLEDLVGAALNNPEFGYLPAKALATGVVVFWNYFANRYWTFGNTRMVKNRTASTTQQV